MHILASHQTLLLAFGDGTVPVLGWWLLEVVPFGAGGLSALLLSVGLVGSAILDRFFGSDDENGDDDDPLMNGGGLDGGMDDPFGDGDDDMGGMDDPFGDDPFGDGDDGGDDTDELDHRLSELEGEVARLSSTVNTVRSENTEISNTVDDIGENVRKLLDIYEMVTRGINPFVDDVQPSGGAGGFENGSLGLFDNDDDEEDEEELDDSIASADAEGFFDDDLLDEEDDEFDDDFGDLDDDFDESEGDGFGDGEVTEEMETEVSDSGGKSFSELKEEYESGDADWAEEDFDVDEEDDEDDLEFGDDDDLGFGDDEADDGFGDDLLGEEADAVPVETDEMLFESEEEEEEPVLATDGAAVAADAGVDDTESDTLEADDDTDDDTGFEFGNTAESGDGTDESPKPYLTTLPDAYIGDLLVIEWLEYLVEQSDVVDAARAIRYYERIDWVGSDVARTLEEFLVGFGDVNVAETERPGTSDLSLSHHVRSLEYVQALAGPMPGGAQLSRGLRRSRGGDDGF